MGKAELEPLLGTTEEETERFDAASRRFARIQIEEKDRRRSSSMTFGGLCAAFVLIFLAVLAIGFLFVACFRS